MHINIYKYTQKIAEQALKYATELMGLGVIFFFFGILGCFFKSHDTNQSQRWFLRVYKNICQLVRDVQPWIPQA